MVASEITAGQRWVSDSEPELGLGVVQRAEFGRVEMFFAAANEQRLYAVASAPLRRVRYKAGDVIALQDQTRHSVRSVEERGGLLVYRTDSREVAEAELSDSISFTTPQDRLFGGQVDDLTTLGLRVEALQRRSEIRQSPVRGLVGGRIELIPHQLSVVDEVASRLAPRVLLADEVGLGKTIEACLILHRLHLTGRADRVLILVPEPLIHQWFVELLRRFNLLFSIFDEERCAAIQGDDAAINPFLDSQLVLSSLAFVAADRPRAAQAIAAGWDLVIVDEAHHLEWSQESASASYRAVEALATETPALLLLTATPQQLGWEGHFARLRLLDPVRYSELARFREEAEHYEEVAKAVDRLLGGGTLPAEDCAIFGARSPRLQQHCDALAAGGDGRVREQLIADLLDGFGIGRVMFRHTRGTLSGFPKREALLIALEPAATEVGVKVRWLAGLLKALPDEKVLLICRTRELAEEVVAALHREMNVNCALFHEGLTLLQRDRNAAYFAEGGGARLLVCSEIGSEGRNFQFAHYLVLLDLPEDPELLEQRIGRLDRIGQTGVIHILVPYLQRTDSEVLARWYHEGLDAFEKTPHGAGEIAGAVGRDLTALLETFDAMGLERLIARTREQKVTVAERLARGHDRLLELNSSRPGRAAEVIAQMRMVESSKSFEDFLIRLLDHFGVHVEDLGHRSYLLLPGHLITEAFPALPPEGLSVTFDRARAVQREDIGFMSPDHPLVRGAIDLLLGSERGNTAYAVWEAPGPETIYLEAWSVLECVAPATLHVDRFLAPVPVRVVVDHALADRTKMAGFAAPSVEKGDIFQLLDQSALKTKLLPAMLARAQEIATDEMERLLAAAKGTMHGSMEREIERLEVLSEINDHVHPREITALKNQRQKLDGALDSARLRLDALRLILRRPPRGSQTGTPRNRP